MGFPFPFSEGFEGATLGAFDANSATAPTYAHYTALARLGATPYRGAFAMQVPLTGGTTSIFAREDASFDTAAAGTIFIKFSFYLAKDFVMADGDKFSMMELESVLDTTTEVACGIDRNGSNIRFWFAETQAAATVRTFTLGTTTTALGKWYQAEVKALIDSGVPNDGTIDAWVDGTSAGAQITALDQGAIVDAKFGVIGPDAGTSGSVLIDEVLADDARLFPDKNRFRDLNTWVTHTRDHPILGSGRFSAAVTGTGTNAVLELYDSDGVPDKLEPIAVLRNVSANELIPGQDKFEVNHGLYTVMSGTEAQAFISIDRGGLTSEARLIERGLRQGVPR